MTVLLFIAILMVLVFVHELGHFIAARLSGVRVDEFAIGFPPRIFSTMRGGTRYTVGILPFGGFVKLLGEDGEEGDATNREQSLVHKHPLIKIAVLAGGVIMNLLLGWILISGGLYYGLPISESSLPAGATLENPRLVIVEVIADSPASRAVLIRGDVVTKVSDAKGAEVLLPTVEAFQTFVHAHGGQVISLTVESAGKTRTLSVEPKVSGAEPAVIGVGLDRVGTLRYPFLRSFVEGARMTALLTYATARAIGHFAFSLVTSGSGLDQVTGPVGLAGMVGAAQALGWTYVLTLVAIISVNLALINILPFPALDGGRILFVLIEWVRGKTFSERVSTISNLLGFALLILLMVFITWSDIAKLIGWD